VIFNEERARYGSSLLLWNSASHDVGGYYADPYQALVRYMVGCTMAGTPHVLYGQELGTFSGFGFNDYTVSGSESVPDLFTFNSLQPAIAAGIGNQRIDQLYPLFASVGLARQSSPALRGANYCFLTSSSPQPNIYAVAKFETTNGSPNFHDVVFAFVNLDVTNAQQGHFNVNVSCNGANLFGIQPGRLYNVKNLAAYQDASTDRRQTWLWSGGIAGSNLLANGIFVSLNAVPTANAGWTNAPFEAQYLKLYDVTPPVALAPPSSFDNYVVSNVVTFTWPALNDAIGGVSGYFVTVGTSPGAANVYDGVCAGTSLALTNAYGTTLYAQVSAINSAGIIGSASASSSGVTLVDPAWIPVLSMQNPKVLKWTSVSGKTYQIWSTTNLNVPFSTSGEVITAMGPTILNTDLNLNATRFYRIQVFP
jgi:hypothetical protein